MLNSSLFSQFDRFHTLSQDASGSDGCCESQSTTDSCDLYLASASRCLSPDNTGSIKQIGDQAELEMSDIDTAPDSFGNKPSRQLLEADFAPPMPGYHVDASGTQSDSSLIARTAAYNSDDQGSDTFTADSQPPEPTAASHAFQQVGPNASFTYNHSLWPPSQNVHGLADEGEHSNNSTLSDRSASQTVAIDSVATESADVDAAEQEETFTIQLGSTINTLATDVSIGPSPTHRDPLLDKFRMNHKGIPEANLEKCSFCGTQYEATSLRRKGMVCTVCPDYVECEVCTKLPDEEKSDTIKAVVVKLSRFGVFDEQTVMINHDPQSHKLDTMENITKMKRLPKVNSEAFSAIGSPKCRKDLLRKRLGNNPVPLHVRHGNIKDFSVTVGMEISSGAFASVYKCFIRGVPFAVKCISRSSFIRAMGSSPLADTINKGSRISDLISETAVLRRLHHPNIVTLRFVFVDEDRDSILFVMELLKNGPFYRYGEPPLPPAKLRSFAVDILAGLLHMHSKGYYHLDIKPDNILVSKDNRAKLVDFGCASHRETLYATKGTPAFNSPEVCNNRLDVASAPAADAWAFAITLLIAATGELPYPKEYVNREHVPKLVSFIGDCEKAIYIPPDLKPPSLRNLLAKMLDKDPSTRWDLLQAADNQYFRDEWSDAVLTSRKNANFTEVFWQADMPQLPRYIKTHLFDEWRERLGPDNQVGGRSCQSFSLTLPELKAARIEKERIVDFDSNIKEWSESLTKNHLHNARGQGEGSLTESSTPNHHSIHRHHQMASRVRAAAENCFSDTANEERSRLRSSIILKQKNSQDFTHYFESLAAKPAKNSGGLFAYHSHPAEDTLNFRSDVYDSRLLQKIATSPYALTLKTLSFSRAMLCGQTDAGADKETSIPITLGPLWSKFKSLTRLRINNCFLTTFPMEVLRDCPSLTFMDLGFNCLTDILFPPGSSELRLRKLSVKANLIRSLPSALTWPSGLTILNICDNQITHFPEDLVARCKKLENRKMQPHSKHKHEMIIRADDHPELFAAWDALIDNEVVCAYTTLEWNQKYPTSLRTHFLRKALELNNAFADVTPNDDIESQEGDADESAPGSLEEASEDSHRQQDKGITAFWMRNVYIGGHWDPETYFGVVATALDIRHVVAPSRARRYFEEHLKSANIVQTMDLLRETSCNHAESYAPANWARYTQKLRTSATLEYRLSHLPASIDNIKTVLQLAPAVPSSIRSNMISPSFADSNPKSSPELYWQGSLRSCSSVSLASRQSRRSVSRRVLPPSHPYLANRSPSISEGSSVGRANSRRGSQPDSASQHGSTTQYGSSIHGDSSDTSLDDKSPQDGNTPPASTTCEVITDVNTFVRTSAAAVARYIYETAIVRKEKLLILCDLPKGDPDPFSLLDLMEEEGKVEYSTSTLQTRRASSSMQLGSWTMTNATERLIIREAIAAVIVSMSSRGICEHARGDRDEDVACNSERLSTGDESSIPLVSGRFAHETPSTTCIEDTHFSRARNLFTDDLEHHGRPLTGDLANESNAPSSPIKVALDHRAPWGDFSATNSPSDNDSDVESVSHLNFTPKHAAIAERSPHIELKEYAQLVKATGEARHARVSPRSPSHSPAAGCSVPTSFQHSDGLGIFSPYARPHAWRGQSLELQALTRSDARKIANAALNSHRDFSRLLI